MELYEHKKIEQKWREKWDTAGVYKMTEDIEKEKFYILDMFPYPSGAGLHVGHPKGYIATDIIARYKKMRGFNVLHPMGWDAFGLPAEQYALKNKVHPRVATQENIATFKNQIEKISLNYDWDREFSTTDPDYYKWTQWTFLQMFKKGLVYRSHEPINWCPSCKTGLANEDLEDGACERCGTPVEKKKMPQWVIKITDYADRMLADLDQLDWQDNIKQSQRNWIGRSEGATVKFILKEKETKNTSHKVILMHGKDTDPSQKWYPWLADEMQKKNITFHAPTLKKADDPHVDEWLVQLDEAHPTEDTILIGHSRGGVAILRWLEKQPENFRVKKVILVATNYAKCDQKHTKDNTHGFYTDAGYDFEEIKKHCDDFVVLHSKDDEWVSFEHGEINAQGLDADFLKFNNRGHFGSTLKKQEIPELLNLISSESVPSIEVFTTRVDTIFSGAFVVLAPEHELVEKLKEQVPNVEEVEEYQKMAQKKTEIDRTATDREKTGVELKGISVINPATSKEIPVWISDFVLAQYGTGAVFADAHDQRDFVMAKKYKIPLTVSIRPKNDDAWEKVKNFEECYEDDGILVNSGDFDGLTSEEARSKITQWLAQKDLAHAEVSYRLRDWVFGRQRYWGEPIPLIHCEKCGVVAVPEEELPLKLPDVEKYEPTDTGQSPLAGIDEWVNTTCPECGALAKRETDTMPQWAGSSWYYLRYIDPKNDTALVDKEKEKYWSPVDFYVGGAEHATRHLIYARFWHKFLFDIGVVSHDEPFAKLQTVGLIMAEDGRKMSKRWENVINPDDVIERFGADTFRTYEMFMGPFDASVAWSTEGMIGPRKFLERIWKIYHKDYVGGKTSESLKKTLHKTIKKVGEDIEEMKYNTAISAMMILANQTEKEKDISTEDFGVFLKILSPFAPHMTQELWEQMDNTSFLIEEDWPSYEEEYLSDDEIELVIQVNGKVRDKIMVAAGIAEDDAKEKALTSEKVQKFIDGKEVRKVIFVQGKLVSIVV